MIDEKLDRELESFFGRHGMPAPVFGDRPEVQKQKIIDLLNIMEEKLFPGFIKRNEEGDGE